MTKRKASDGLLATARPVKIYFGGSSQQRQSRLQQAQKLLGKASWEESSPGEDRF